MSSQSLAIGAVALMSFVIAAVYLTQKDDLKLAIRSCLEEDTQSLLKDDGYVRQCITGEIVGRVPSTMTTAPLDRPDQLTVKESDEARKHVFQKVFDKRFWVSNRDSEHKGVFASGGGSSLHFAQEMIATLHSVVSQLKRAYGLSRIRLLDVPCGDLVWMSRFLRTRDDVDYTGVDIVPNLIDNNRRVFASHKNWKFILSDVVRDGVGNLTSGDRYGFDLVLCRHMLPHLLHRDGLAVLHHLADIKTGDPSRPLFLLTTTHADQSVNKANLPGKVGRWNYLNLELPPFRLTPPLCIFRDAPVYKEHTFGVMYQLPVKRVIGDAVKQVVVPDVPYPLFSVTDWTLGGTNTN